MSVAPPPSPKGGFDKCVALGAGKAALPWKKIAVLGVVSGVHIGLGAFLALSVGGSIPTVAAATPGIHRAIMGMFGLPLGLFLTLVAGGELFTGNTLMVTAAVLEGKATWKDLTKNWTLSYLGNFVGAVFVAWLATQTNTLKASIDGHLAMAVARCSQPFVQAFIRGIMGNYLVCMAVLMGTNASDIASKAVAVVLPISAFVAMGLDHCIANMFFISFGMMNGADVSVGQFLSGNLLPVTLGNVLGGAVAVAGTYQFAFGSKN